MTREGAAGDGRDGGAAPARPARASPGTKGLAAVALILSGGYAALLGSLDSLPYQDLPNHLARAAIEADHLFEGGRRYGQAFSVDLALRPYLGGDLLLAGLVSALGPGAGGRLWVIAVAASLPLAIAGYLRWTGHSARGVLLSVPPALYLSTDWSFLSGFHHYRLSLALVVGALAAGQAWLARGSPAALLAWAALLAGASLVHLAGLVLGAAGAAAVALASLATRRTTWRRVVAGALPVLALGAWQVGAGGVPAGVARWGWARKLPRLVSPYYRFDWRADAVLGAALVLLCALLLVRWRAARSEPRLVIAASLALAFLGCYAALPFESGKVFYVDSRALPLAVVFTLVAGLAVVERAGRLSAWIPGLAALLAAGNLAALAVPLGRHDAVLREYRRVAARIPPGARVLPVVTAPPAGHVDPYLHAGAFATVDAAAVTPYLFSGGPHAYLRYRDPARGIPDEFWYRSGRPLREDERREILSRFDYVLVMKPYEPGRLALPACVVASSSVAELLELDR